MDFGFPAMNVDQEVGEGLVVGCGYNPAVEAVFDLKTRSIKRRPELQVLQEELPRL